MFTKQRGTSQHVFLLPLENIEAPSVSTGTLSSHWQQVTEILHDTKCSETSIQEGSAHMAKLLRLKVYSAHMKVAWLLITFRVRYVLRIWLHMRLPHWGSSRSCIQKWDKYIHKGLLMLKKKKTALQRLFFTVQQQQYQKYWHSLYSFYNVPLLQDLNKTENWFCRAPFENIFFGACQQKQCGSKQKACLLYFWQVRTYP